MDGLLMIGILLLIAGFILVGVEMVLPGFGAPGIIGGICLVGGIFCTADDVEQGLTITVIVVMLLAIMFAIILSLFHMKKIKPPIVLQEELKAEKGYLSSSDLEYLVGKEGTATTDLRPAGKGSFDGIEFDILSGGNYIKKGQKIAQITVEPVVLCDFEMADKLAESDRGDGGFGSTGIFWEG